MAYRHFCKQADYEAVRGALIVKHNTHPTQTAERVAAKLSERGVAKVHPASKFAGTAPEDDIADALADLASGRAHHIDSAGPLAKEGALTGSPKALRGQPGSITYRSDIRENEAAVTLSQRGYKVEQLPEPTGGTSILDYRINGHDYDCYAPWYDGTGDHYIKSKEMWSRLKRDKTDIGKTRIVLNLDDHLAPMSDVVKAFQDAPLNDLDDILIVKNNQVVPFWEFLH